MNQVISIIDDYRYWPMVRQVFSQRVFRPLEGEFSDEREITAGLKAAQKVLAVFNFFSNEGHVLNGAIITLASCHLAPMMDYFVRAKEGRIMLDAYPALNQWWKQAARTSMVQFTDPDLSQLSDLGIGN